MSAPAHLQPLAAAAAHPAPTPLDVDVLAEIVDGLARAESLWRPHVAHDPDVRVRVRLLATAAYEVWLLGWTPGQSVGLHDHGEANGAFAVVAGELTETSLAGGRPADEVLTAGMIGRVPAGAVHDVANRASQDATSIHAYSNPLTAMGFYRGDGTLDRVDAVDEEAALLDGRIDGVLHPSATIRR